MSNDRFRKLVSDAKTRVREITPAEAHQSLQNGAIIIDVREDGDWKLAHIDGAMHLSRGIIELEIEETVPDPGTPIICYCGGGNRSALVTDSLQKMGYTNVRSLAGGFHAWNQAELPVAHSS